MKRVSVDEESGGGEVFLLHPSTTGFLGILQEKRKAGLPQTDKFLRVEHYVKEVRNN
jgi:hypothetical protein